MCARLRNYADIADAMAALFQPFVEVVVHDLSSEKVVYVANNFSNRELGDPSLLHEIDFNPNDRVIGPYEKVNFDGRRIKSISVVLRDEHDEAVAILCMNADVSHFHVAKQAFEALVSLPANGGKPDALFKDDWHERINEFVTQWTADTGKTLAQLTKSEKRALVLDLAESGAFGGKHAAAYVSRIVGLSRATVYNYLKRMKMEA